jgi:hypothetical protein
MGQNPHERRCIGDSYQLKNKREDELLGHFQLLGWGLVVPLKIVCLVAGSVWDREMECWHLEGVYKRLDRDGLRKTRSSVNKDARACKVKGLFLFFTLNVLNNLPITGGSGRRHICGSSCSGLRR